MNVLTMNFSKWSNPVSLTFVWPPDSGVSPDLESEGAEEILEAFAPNEPFQFGISCVEARSLLRTGRTWPEGGRRSPVAEESAPFLLELKLTSHPLKAAEPILPADLNDMQGVGGPPAAVCASL